MLNFQGRSLSRLVTSARTSGLTSIQGDLGESGKDIVKYQLRAILSKGFFSMFGPPKESIFFDHHLQSIFQSSTHITN